MKLFCLFAGALAVFGQNIEEKQTIERTFPSVTRLEVDNMHGSIRVTGRQGREARVVVRQTISAESQDTLQRARQDVRLDISQQGETGTLYVDGPFRCRCGDGSINYRGSRHYGYKVIYDFEIEAPREAFLQLKTINDGDIKVENTTGGYDIENINGRIEMLDVSGSGRVYALNRPLKVVFQKNPSSASSFRTLNGPMDLYFQPDLSADLWLKTFNGAIYSDFPMTYLPALQPPPERRDGKVVYKSNRFFGARVGSGGPEIKLDGFNGTIRILQRGNQ